MGLFSFLFKRSKPVIGLCLGSGGAKGFAHLGALKAFEDLHITFDVVGGTSIGSIIGAFYADGYTVTDINGLLGSLNIKEMLTGLPINMDMSGINKNIDRAIGGKSIEELAKPFVCVATDIDTFEEVVFTSGKVGTAVSASSCYLPYFRPVVDTEGRRLIDGAYVNSIPADRVKDLGADYIISVDLSAFTEKDFKNKQFPGASDNPSEQGYKHSDIMITPNLKNYKATNVFARHDMYELGYNAVMTRADEIKLGLKNAKKRKIK